MERRGSRGIREKGAKGRRLAGLDQASSASPVGEHDLPYIPVRLCLMLPSLMHCILSSSSPDIRSPSSSPLSPVIVGILKRSLPQTRVLSPRCGGRPPSLSAPVPADHLAPTSNAVPRSILWLRPSARHKHLPLPHATEPRFSPSLPNGGKWAFRHEAATRPTRRGNGPWSWLAADTGETVLGHFARHEQHARCLLGAATSCVGEHGCLVCFAAAGPPRMAASCVDGIVVGTGVLGR